MSITEKETAFVNTSAVSLGLAQMFSVTAASSNPTYLVLTALDRNEYTAGASGTTGTLSGNGHSLSLGSIGGDARSAGIAFTYQASTGRYYNSIYGYLDQLTYNSSASLGDVTNLSLFASNSLSQATADAGSAYAMAQADAAGYLGSATIVTQPKFTATVPTQATPDSIVAVADSFVGQAWNMNGCWILASTITAEAGASLPVQSSLVGLPGQPNGEWIVAFDGPAGQSGNWQAMVTAGEMVVIETVGGGGHITTCVSGTGSSAMLVDNITYISGSNQIQNAANDGSSSDVIIAAPHSAAQEWSGVTTSSVVIYELDTPVVTTRVASDSLSVLASQVLASLFTATDPAGKTISEWQVYDTASSDMLVMNGADYSDHTAASAVTETTLSVVSLLAGSTQTTDMLEVRAYNGSYWGDWTSFAVSIVSSAPAPTPAQPSPPVLVAATAAQAWLGGKTVALTLPAGTFTDPQGQKLTYAATLANGQALPSWLTFNSTTETFGGAAPTTAQNLSIVVTAKDTGGLSTTDAFSVSVIGTPTVTSATPNQTWTAGKAINLLLPANTFTDPQGEHLSYTTMQYDGQALPSWLAFNAATGTFSGSAPSTAQNLDIMVTATDTSGLSSSESFTAAVQSATPVIQPGIVVRAQTPNQTWTDGEAANLVLPANTFTDALGLKMTFTAYEVAGPNVTSWLHFNTAISDLCGTVPGNLSGTAEIEIMATDAQHVSGTDLFSVTFAPAGKAGVSSIQETSASVVPSSAGQAAGILALQI